MNKNMIIAFVLIFATIMLFQKYETSQIKKQQIDQPKIAYEKKQSKDEKSDEKVSMNSNDKIHTFSSLDILDTTKKTVTIDTVWVENDKMICGITQMGARIISLKMKEYGYDRVKPKLSDLKEQVDLVASPKFGGGNLKVDGEEFDTKMFQIENFVKKITISSNQKGTVTFSSVDSKGSKISKRYSFDGNSYKIGYEILSPTLEGKSITVGWKCGITESEMYSGKPGNNNQSSYINEQRKAHVFDGKSIEHIQFKKPEKKEETGMFKWAAVTSKYFMVAIVPDSMKDGDFFIEGYDAKENDLVKIENKKIQNIDYSMVIKRSADSQREGYWIFAGPTKLSLLRSFNNSFQKVLFGGYEWMLWANVWFPIICEYTLLLLSFIENIVRDYGITIILLTILIKLITFPLSQSSMKSMNKMKLLQPKINAIKERYKSNPKKMNEEIMLMYREEGVNPLNPGCLPMFLQMPILIALFVVLQKAIELRGAHTWLMPWVNDLSQPEILISLKQMHLDTIFPNGIPMYGYGFAVMPVIMAILTFFQNKMTIKDPNQKAMIYFMPVFMLVIFNNFPAGLVFYWTFSNALGIVQQAILDKTMSKEMKALKAKVEKKPQQRVKGKK